MESLLPFLTRFNLSLEEILATCLVVTVFVQAAKIAVPKVEGLTAKYVTAGAVVGFSLLTYLDKGWQTTAAATLFVAIGSFGGYELLKVPGRAVAKAVSGGAGSTDGGTK